MLKRFIKSKVAFTLLELLVVIGIIALLASLGAVSYNSIKNRSKDAKAISDLTNIAKALDAKGVLTNDYVTGLTNAAGDWTNLLNAIEISNPGQVEPPAGYSYCYYYNDDGAGKIEYALVVSGMAKDSYNDYTGTITTGLKASTDAAGTPITAIDEIEPSQCAYGIPIAADICTKRKFRFEVQSNFYCLYNSLESQY